MLWNVNEPTDSNALSLSLVPLQVLYFYDGPILFTMRMGLFDLLVYKVDEQGEFDLFLLKQISEREIDRLQQERLSLRGALESESYWLVETKGRLEVQRTWRVLAENLPEEYLPEPGLGLAPSSKKLPDTLLQSDAFFAVRFTGDALRHGQMSFRLFKELTDKFYSACNRLLKPEAIMGLRSRDVFDLPMMEPHFSSLVVALQQPKIDTALVNLRNHSRKIATSIDFVEETVRRRRLFFSAVDEVVSEAKGRGLTSAYAAQHFMLLQSIEGLLPTEDNSVRTTEFSADGELSREHVYITSETARSLRNAFSEAQTRPLTVTGRIELINGRAFTFVLRDLVSGRAITCHLGKERFTRSDEAGNVHNGALVEVVGSFRSRKQRDWLEVQRDPIFKSAPELRLEDLF